ncbi:Uncharacterized [Moorella glycerini]|uniref:Uncharacterized protein n=1 Tax=Neomoorella stamsii TaxID=1266720 RepID=A0A9X7J4D6_9FIRM|nr:hypothetical protein MOST_07980 [Moorella stamsii]CEP66471.1 Uncharacterized [Moorella glycerini]
MNRLSCKREPETVYLLLCFTVHASARVLGPGGQVVLVQPADGDNWINLQGTDGLGHVKDILVGSRWFHPAVGAQPVNGLSVCIGPRLRASCQEIGTIISYFLFLAIKRSPFSRRC